MCTKTNQFGDYSFILPTGKVLRRKTRNTHYVLIRSYVLAKITGLSSFSKTEQIFLEYDALEIRTEIIQIDAPEPDCEVLNALRYPMCYVAGHEKIKEIQKFPKTTENARYLQVHKTLLILVHSLHIAYGEKFAPKTL